MKSCLGLQHLGGPSFTNLAVPELSQIHLLLMAPLLSNEAVLAAPRTNAMVHDRRALSPNHPSLPPQP